MPEQPPPPPGSKPPPPDRRTRGERLKAQGVEPDLPEVRCGGHLIGWLFEIGPTVPGGAGPAPLTHSEIRSWQENTGLSLTPWEARTLRHLSREYLGELHAAEKPGRPEPMVARDEEHRTQTMQRVAKDLRATISAKARG